MSLLQQKYCLDANVLIQAWQKYYSPQLCPSYWDMLNALGSAQKIFLPYNVADEITRTEDDLAQWLKDSQIPIHPITEPVIRALRDMYVANPVH